MLNLTPNTNNNLIIYADTVGSDSVGNFFMFIFTNSYSRETFAVNPTIVRRNARFVELSVDLVGVNELNDPYNGKIYLYPAGNWTYTVFNTSAPSLDPLYQPLACAVWNTDEDFWNFSRTVWNVCEITYKIIDRGQAFLQPIVECEDEIQFQPYTLANNDFQSIVYVQQIPLYQFPCTIESGTVFEVDKNIVTYCPEVLIENDGVLLIDNPFQLTQKNAPFGYC
jgi:hypothetical protein